MFAWFEPILGRSGARWRRNLHPWLKDEDNVANEGQFMTRTKLWSQRDGNGGNVRRVGAKANYALSRVDNTVNYFLHLTFTQRQRRWKPAVCRTKPVFFRLLVIFHRTERPWGAAVSSQNEDTVCGPVADQLNGGFDNTSSCKTTSQVLYPGQIQATLSSWTAAVFLITNLGVWHMIYSIWKLENCSKVFAIPSERRSEGFALVREKAR